MVASQIVTDSLAHFIEQRTRSPVATCTVDSPAGLSAALCTLNIESEELVDCISSQRAVDCDCTGFSVHSADTIVVHRYGTLADSQLILARVAANVTVAERLIACASESFQLTEQRQALLECSRRIFAESLLSMGRSIQVRDRYTLEHCRRVAELATELAGIYGLSIAAQQEVYFAGLLHDLGKIAIPDNLLLKAGRLTDDEFAIVKSHPAVGYQLAEQNCHLDFALPGILYHHERWDGQGYPHGIAGRNIPLIARVLSVADAFDAMTTTRPYRTAMVLDKAVGIIRNGRGTQWDGVVVDCLDEWLDSARGPIEIQPPEAVEEAVTADDFSGAVLSFAC